MPARSLFTHHRSRPTLARVATACLVTAVLIGTSGLAAPPPVRAAGVIIQVTTTADAEFPADMGCSLRAAILAANVGGFAGYCDAGTAQADSIRFQLGSGTPQINVGSALPAITQAVTISGNTGGATRIKVHGPGGGIGLPVNASGATIRNLVVDGFSAGISVAGDNFKVTGSILGPNDEFGIFLSGLNATIGGTTGVTPGGPCTGECNLVVGNDTGIRLGGSGTALGNFVGTTESGSLPIGNEYGIVVSGGTWTIGGAAAGAGNLLSGNGLVGLSLNSCADCVVQGNRIGTTAAGSAGLSNQYGISADDGTTLLIGGTAPGAGNLVSANTVMGIQVEDTGSATIQGNRIGTTLNGAPLGNGGDGIFEGGNVGMSGSLIGSATEPAAANVIAYNGGAGIRIVGTLTPTGSPNNSIRGNSIFANDGPGIVLEDSNNGIAAPVIGGFKPLRGAACPGCSVDIYSDDADEGRVFEGTVTASGGGEWTYPELFAGWNVTATATDGSGNTSAFSAPGIPTTPFTDVAGSLFAKEIAWLYANGITLGCTATKYCPTNAVSRQEMASFLVRMFKLPPTATDYFTDDEASIHEPKINALAASGITSGCTATKFCPTAKVLRDQMASFLARATGITAGAGRDYFNDDDGSLHEANIDRNAAAGLTAGCDTYIYCPSGAVTREQMAAFLRRVIAPIAPPPYPAPN